jgi:hypothetical protein
MYMTLPFFVFSYAAARIDIDKCILWTCHIVLALSLYSILGDFSGLTHYETGLSRFFGFLGDQAAWPLTLPLVVYFSMKRIPLAAIGALGLALTASRAPTIITLASVLLLMLFARGHRLQYFAVLFVLAVILVYEAGLFSTLLGRISATELINDRTITARLGLRIFRESPIFGSGYNSLQYLYPSTMHLIFLGVLPSQTSTFVQILSDWGLVVFVPYFAFVLSCTISGISLMRQSRAFRNGSVINGAVAWLLAMLWINQSALWFVVGSYVGPLVFGVAGLISGSQARLQSLAPLSSPLNAAQPHGIAHPSGDR